MLKKLIDRIEGLPLAAVTLGYMGVVLHFAGLLFLVVILLFGLPGCSAKPPLEHCMRDQLP